MKKRVATVVAMVVAVCAVAAPIALTIYQARKWAQETEAGHALSYAQDVLRRSERVSDQVFSSFGRLRAASYTPCSDEELVLMRQITMGSSYVRAIGRVKGDRLVCSSLGRHGEGLPLGSVKTQSANGTWTRPDVAFDFAPATSFVVAEQGHFAAILDKSLPLDANTGRPDITLGVFSQVTGDLLTARGNANLKWLTGSPPGSDGTFVKDNNIVAVVSSRRYHFGAVAAIPLTYLEREVRAMSVRLVPIGLIGGLLLAFAFLYVLRQQLAWPAVIRAALKRSEFFLLYQPVVDLHSGKWVGAEALIRWRRSDGEMVRPDLFIPVAEEMGLIRLITRRVVELVERDAKDLFQRFPDFHLALNLSPQDLRTTDSVDLIKGLAERMNAGRGNLVVEVTEHGFMKPDVAREVVQRLRAEGIRVAIDDFGTGYSSLSYLETFELDALKIDKAFVDTIGVETATSHVVSHIIEMAKALKLEMIAEGVETHEQAEYLRVRGVQYAQGWLYAKAMPMKELVSRLGSASG